MAQKRFWNWKDDDSTEMLSRWTRGFFADGVYYGFDGDLTTPGLNLSLTHTATGMTQVNGALNQVTGIGVALTKQGVMVQEDGPIVLPIGANGTANPRIDLIVMEHDYQTVVGGTSAIYLVIQGTPNASPVAPALTVPNKQIILGTLYMPATASSLQATGVVYTKNTINVFLNDPSILRTNVAQTSTESKFMSHIRSLFSTAGMVGTTLTLSNPGGKPRNMYYMANPLNITTRVIVNTINDTVGAGNFFYVVSEYKLKLKSISTGGQFFTPGQGDVYVEPGEKILFVNTDGLTGGGTTWAVVAGSAEKGIKNKMRKLLQLNKDPNMLLVTGYGELILSDEGNMFELDANGIPFLYTIQSKNQADAVGDDATEAGTGVWIKNAGSIPITVQVNQSVMSGYKPMKTHNGQNFVFEVGASMYLLEDTDGWWLMQYISSTNTPMLKYLDDNEDVVFGAVTDGDVLYYDTGAGGWINYSLESILVSGTRQFIAMQKFTDVNVGSSYSAGVLNINTNGNMFTFLMPLGNLVINDIQLMGNPAPNGSLIALKCTGFSGGSGFAVAQWNFSAGTNFAPYDLSTGPQTNIVFSAGAYFYFYRSGNKWHLLSSSEVYTRLSNIDTTLGSAVTDITQLQTDRAFKSIDSWHVVGSGGGNPNYGYAGIADAPGRTSKYIKDDVGGVSVRIAITTSGSVVSGATVWTLPIGYRPAVAFDFVVHKYVSGSAPTAYWANVSSVGVITINDPGGSSLPDADYFGQIYFKI